MTKAKDRTGEHTCCECGYDVSQDPRWMQKCQTIQYTARGGERTVYRCLDCQLMDKQVQ